MSRVVEERDAPAEVPADIAEGVVAHDGQVAERIPGLRLEGGHLLTQPVHVLGQRVDRWSLCSRRTPQRDHGQDESHERDGQGEGGGDQHADDTRRRLRRGRRDTARRGKIADVTDPAPAPRRRIAYQGEPGANSHLVCQQHYPDWDAVPCASFEDAFASVEAGDADLAMIPIDNSIAGRVADIHHFLPTSDLHIIGERFLRIQFALMAAPGASTSSLRTVHSHVHALGQCRGVIRELGLTPIVSGDTAGAAREVAEAGDPTQAAIAPPLAAEIYGLEILRRDVEDEEHNTTRFIVLSRDFEQAPRDGGQVITTFIFNVRNLPAALYKALGGFATNGVNMTKLESYMVEGHFTATQFLAEIDGHPEDVGVKNALEELAFFTTEVKVLGVYPADAFRTT